MKKEKRFSENIDDIVFSKGKSSADIQKIKRLYDKGSLIKVYQGIYSTNIQQDLSTIINKNLWKIVGSIAPNSVISHRSSFELKPSEDNELFLTRGAKARNVAVGNLSLKILKGQGKIKGDRDFIEGLFISSPARSILENLTPSRGSKNIGKEYIEELLLKNMKQYGEKYLLRLRDELKETAEILKMDKEYKYANSLIGTLLGTNSMSFSSQYVKGFISGTSYDQSRVEMFLKLEENLDKYNPLPIPVNETFNGINSNLPFYESYFSNYIEGTKFTLEEAKNIILNPEEDYGRPTDSHDVRGVYSIIKNKIKTICDNDPIDSVEHIKDLRYSTMSNNKKVNPGNFKTISNMAGNTVFVNPEDLTGTLIEGIKILNRIKNPLSKAIFAQFMIAETHPFNDGNGRLSRIIMNSFLDEADVCRIIIPTVFREDYISALKRLSSTGDSYAFIKTMDKAHQFTASIDFSTKENAELELENANAFSEDINDVLVFSTRNDNQRNNFKC